LVEFGRSSDLIKFVLDRPMANAPGQVFNYNSGNPHLLSAIITKLSGMSAWDYAKAKLFAPLGIEVSNWHHDPQGVTTGGGGLVLYPRDMAKIGYLYLRNGEWEGKRLLPAGWTDRVSHATVNMNASFDPELRYANFFLVLPPQASLHGLGNPLPVHHGFSCTGHGRGGDGQGSLSVRQAGR
jgi:CubicO group peptidase (beta-lactamase class C family)